MKIYIYDGSWPGILCCVFQSFARKEIPDKILKMGEVQTSIIDETIEISTDEEQAKRVLTGLENKFSKKVLQLIYYSYLSELDDAGFLIVKFVKLIYKETENILENFAEPVILKLFQIEKMINREAHRFQAFVRFNENDGIFHSLITPDFNVLPLLGDFFEKRYADQHWFIFDKKRGYGILYNKEKVTEVTLDSYDQTCFGLSESLILKGSEYEQLWRVYFNSVNIPERENIKLQLKHVPRRNWKYLPEKKI